jgi:hypothetical protein
MAMISLRALRARPKPARRRRSIGGWMLYIEWQVFKAIVAAICISAIIASVWLIVTLLTLPAHAGDSIEWPGPLQVVTIGDAFACFKREDLQKAILMADYDVPGADLFRFAIAHDCFTVPKGTLLTVFPEKSFSSAKNEEEYQKIKTACAGKTADSEDCIWFPIWKLDTLANPPAP